MRGGLMAHLAGRPLHAGKYGEDHSVLQSRFNPRGTTLNSLTAFGLFAVSAMLICYALEKRSHWFILAFAFACILASLYGFLQGAWPFGVVEAVWSLVAFRRWWLARITG